MVAQRFKRWENVHTNDPVPEEWLNRCQPAVPPALLFSGRTCDPPVNWRAIFGGPPGPYQLKQWDGGSTGYDCPL